MLTPFADAKPIQICIDHRQYLKQNPFLHNELFYPNQACFDCVPSPSHRTLLKGKLGRKVHAGGKTERIGVQHRIVGVEAGLHPWVR